MQLALILSKEDISRAAQLNTYHQNSSTHMSFRRVKKSKPNKYVQTIIWQIYSPNPCKNVHFKS